MTMKDFRIYMRLGHRYVGFFMVGIMLVYSLSGMLLVFRDTDFLKSSKTVKQVVATNLDEKNLAKTLKMKNIDFREPVFVNIVVTQFNIKRLKPQWH